jgi:hypothetical protein
MMRTTVNLPDDVYQAARSVAGARGVSLGAALAELVRRGLKPNAQVNTKKAFPCFHVPPGAKPITLEQTLEAEDDL